MRSLRRFLASEAHYYFTFVARQTLQFRFLTKMKIFWNQQVLSYSTHGSQKSVYQEAWAKAKKNFFFFLDALCKKEYKNDPSNVSRQKCEHVCFHLTEKSCYCYQ